MWPAIIAAGASIAGGLLGDKGTKRQNAANAYQAQKQMDFQERMSSTAHQRQVADMKLAGLNPILSAKMGGSSSPSGAQATMQNEKSATAKAISETTQIALNAKQTASQIKNIDANTRKTDLQSDQIAPEALLKSKITSLMERGIKAIENMNPKEIIGALQGTIDQLGINAEINANKIKQFMIQAGNDTQLAIDNINKYFKYLAKDNLNKVKTDN